MKNQTLEEIAREIREEEEDRKATLAMINAMNDKVACQTAKDVWGTGR
jgi:hypothetical protein